MGTAEETRTVELFVRSLSPPAAAASQDAVLAELDRLADEDVLDGYDLYVWGEVVEPTARAATTRYGGLVVERVQRFREWAEARDATLAGGFETRTRTSRITGESREVVDLPVLTMAEYRDGDLRSVVPVEYDGAAYTVRDRLGALASGGDDASTDQAGPASPPSAVRL